MHDISYRLVPDELGESLNLFTYGKWNLTMRYVKGRWTVSTKDSFVTKEDENKAIAEAQKRYEDGKL